LKVLIVEDDALNRKLYCDVLNLSGFETVSSADGLDAVELAERHRPDAIIMDMRLPHRSGLEITQMIKTKPHLAEIPVIAVSGFYAAEHRKKCLEGGFDEYLPKPVSIWELTKIVCRLVGTPAPQATQAALSSLPVRP